VFTVPQAARSISPLSALRFLSVLVGAIVIIDALAVQAPGLGLLAVPFLAGGALRHERTLPLAVLAAFGVLYVVVGVGWIVANGSDLGDANWGDLLFAFVGTPAALGVAVLAGSRLLHHTGEAEATGAAPAEAG
jgi:hypothetical protein